MDQELNDAGAETGLTEWMVIKGWDMSTIPTQSDAGEAGRLIVQRSLGIKMLW